MSNTHTHTRASQMAEWRDPATEVGDIEILISLGPVQPRNIEFKGTDVLVSGQISAYAFKKPGTQADLGWSTALLKMSSAVSTAVFFSHK